MNNKRVDPTDICDFLSSDGYEFISGKWFKNKIEIKDFSKELYRNVNVRPQLRTDKDTQRIKDTFVDMYGTSGTWPELPIIEEAKKLKELKPMAFPLNEKQLIIINRLIVDNEEKMFILTGVGGSGKSTFANIIKQIFDNDVASLTLDDLGEDFKLATGVNKRLIYADELNSNDLNNGVIKTLVSQQEITVNPKFDRVYKARWQGRLLFSCNKPPKLDLSDTGILRRIVYYSMNEKIKNPDISLQKKEYTHEELVNIVAHALKVDITDWDKRFQKETRDILKTNNSVWLCKGEHLTTTSYAQYCELTKDKGLKPFSEPNWEKVKQLLIEWEVEEDGLPF